MSTRIFYNSQSEAIHLSRRIGIGGEGTVYEIHGKNDLVAKVYHQLPLPEKSEKIIALSRLGSDRLFNLSAWPVDILHDQAPRTDGGMEGNIIGFLMKKIGEAEEVHTLHSPKSRLQKFPDASWAFLIYVAANVARAVSVIHEHGYLIGDVNPKNILVTRKATVYLLDCDSFQISADGKTYRCEGGFPEYTPPELQGSAFKDVNRNQEHDCFGLAVVIFQLLFMGRHPFSGRYLGAGEMPLERAIAEFRFAYGSDAGLRQMQPPPGALAMNAIPVPLIGLFRRAFLSTSRPKAYEWIEPLETLARTLKRCTLHSGHQYFQELAECPWCEIELQARIRLFNFGTTSSNRARGHFRLDEIWKEIESVEAPPISQELVQAHSPLVTVSAPVTEYLKSNRGRFYFSLVFSVLAGFLCGYAGGFCFGLLLLAVMVLITSKIAQKESKQFQLLFQQPLAQSENPFVRQLLAARQMAEEGLRNLEAQWQKAASNERFLAKVGGLQLQKETYQTLAGIRESRLEELESSVKAAQFEEFLDQFEIADADIHGVNLATQILLRSYGIETAADLTQPKLEQVRTIDEVGAKSLRDWRWELGRQFVFDPVKDIPAQVRLNFEREMDELRLRLEHELSSGAYHLRHLKRDIEDNQRKLLPLLTNARKSLAQAELDHHTMTKPVSVRLAIVLLILTFFLGLVVDSSSNNVEPRETPLETLRKDEIAPPRSEFTGEPAVEILPENIEKGRKLYQRGLRLSRANQFEKAAKAFQQSLELAPGFQPAHEELGYSLYRLQRYDEAIGQFEASLGLKPTFRSQYYLGRVYIAQEQWGPANNRLQDAIALIPSQSNWKDEYTLAYDSWGLTLKKIGWINQSINSFEIQLIANPDLKFERFELGGLYLWVEKHEETKEQYRKLKIMNPQLASALRKLMVLHGVR